MADESNHQKPENQIPQAPREAPDPHWVEFLQEHSIPITGVIFGALLLCLIGHYSPVAVDWGRTKDFTDAFRNVTQGLAFVAGGIWAYFKFVKGRTFKESLIPGVSARFTLIDNVTYVVITTQVKNVGLSKIEIDHRSALIMFRYTTSPSTEIHNVDDDRLAVFDVFNKSERYIEPNEIIEWQRLIAMPVPLDIAYRLEVEVASMAGYTWRANCIIDKSSLNEKMRYELFGL